MITHDKQISKEKQTAQNAQQGSKSNLYNIFSELTHTVRPKIKEIISLTAKNLIDLTNCLVLTHQKINNPKYGHLTQLNDLKEVLDKWHEELASGALCTRRNISRLMCNMKYLIGSIRGGDDLFLEIDSIVKPVCENWSPELQAETGKGLRNILLDLALIVDPELNEAGEEDSEVVNGLIESRIEELHHSSRQFLFSRGLNLKIPPNLMTTMNSDMMEDSRGVEKVQDIADNSVSLHSCQSMQEEDGVVEIQSISSQAPSTGQQYHGEEMGVQSGAQTASKRQRFENMFYQQNKSSKPVKTPTKFQPLVGDRRPSGRLLNVTGSVEKRGVSPHKLRGFEKKLKGFEATGSHHTAPHEKEASGLSPRAYPLQAAHTAGTTTLDVSMNGSGSFCSIYLDQSKRNTARGRRGDQMDGLGSHNSRKHHTASTPFENPASVCLKASLTDNSLTVKSSLNEIPVGDLDAEFMKIKKQKDMKKMKEILGTSTSEYNTKTSIRLKDLQRKSCDPLLNVSSNDYHLIQSVESNLDEEAQTDTRALTLTERTNEKHNGVLQPQGFSQGPASTNRRLQGEGTDRSDYYYQYEDSVSYKENLAIMNTADSRCFEQGMQSSILAHGLLKNSTKLKKTPNKSKKFNIPRLPIEKVKTVIKQSGVHGDSFDGLRSSLELHHQAAGGQQGEISLKSSRISYPKSKESYGYVGHHGAKKAEDGGFNDDSIQDNEADNILVEYGVSKSGSKSKKPKLKKVMKVSPHKQNAGPMEAMKTPSKRRKPQEVPSELKRSNSRGSMATAVLQKSRRKSSRNKYKNSQNASLRSSGMRGGPGSQHPSDKNFNFSNLTFNTSSVNSASTTRKMSFGRRKKQLGGAGMAKLPPSNRKERREMKEPEKQPNFQQLEPRRIKTGARLKMSPTSKAAAMDPALGLPEYAKQPQKSKNRHLSRSKETMLHEAAQVSQMDLEGDITDCSSSTDACNTLVLSSKLQNSQNPMNTQNSQNQMESFAKNSPYKKATPSKAKKPTLRRQSYNPGNPFDSKASFTQKEILIPELGNSNARMTETEQSTQHDTKGSSLSHRHKLDSSKFSLQGSSHQDQIDLSELNNQTSKGIGDSEAQIRRRYQDEASEGLIHESSNFSGVGGDYLYPSVKDSSLGPRVGLEVVEEDSKDFKPSRKRNLDEGSGEMMEERGVRELSKKTLEKTDEYARSGKNLRNPENQNLMPVVDLESPESTRGLVRKQSSMFQRRAETKARRSRSRSPNVLGETHNSKSTLSQLNSDKESRDRENKVIESEHTPDKVLMPQANHIFARSPIRTLQDISERKKSARLKGNFDTKKFMSERNSEVIHTNILGNEKIELSPSGDYAYFGGEGLHVLELKGGEYKLVRRDKEKSKQSRPSSQI